LQKLVELQLARHPQTPRVFENNQRFIRLPPCVHPWLKKVLSLFGHRPSLFYFVFVFNALALFFSAAFKSRKLS